MINTQEITLFVFDEKKHFEDHLEFLGKTTFKKIVRVDDESFRQEIENLAIDEFFVFSVHIFYTEKIKGIKKFKASTIKEEFPFIDEIYISDGLKNDIQKEMIDNDMANEVQKVKRYYEIKKDIDNGIINFCTKTGRIASNSQKLSPNSRFDIPQIDYVVITALEDAEMEKVLPMIEFESRIPDKSHLIEYGYFKTNPEKKVAYASQLETGMVDASILATKMIMMFRPKYVIMPGVLGGKPEKTKIGDVVVSTKVFTVDKGKLTKLEFEREIESEDANSPVITSLKRKKKEILRSIEDADVTRASKIDIHFEPTATVRSVINKEGFFLDEISTVDRKSMGLEMEAYGVVRACKLSKIEGVTPLICKAVMDNTKDKTDDSKIYAAWVSAKLLEFSIANDLL